MIYINNKPNPKYMTNISKENKEEFKLTGKELEEQFTKQFAQLLFDHARYNVEQRKKRPAAEEELE
jgi:hypothetical protein